MRETVNRWLIVIVGLFVLLAMCGKAHGQTLGLESKASAGSTSQLGDIYAEALNSKGDKGLFLWGLADTGKFGEIYLGPTWYPRKGVEIQFGAGVENAPGFWRVGGAAYLSGKPGSLNLFWEDGASGYWYKVAYTHHVAGPVALGAFSRRFAGTGPLVEVKASKSYTIWATAGPDLQDHNRMKAVVGLNISAK